MTPFQLETYKSRITLSIETIRLLATFNAGGVIALLTFAGNAHVKLNPALVEQAIWSFGIGATLALLIALAAYIIQSLIDEKTAEDGSLGWTKWAILGVCLAAFASIVLFAVGGLFVAEAHRDCNAALAARLGASLGASRSAASPKIPPK